jgi:hypothetical protein
MKLAIISCFMAGSVAAAQVASWPFERAAPTDKLKGFHRFFGRKLKAQP